MIRTYLPLFSVVVQALFPSMVFCSPEPKAPITIGAIASLSGPAAEQGKNWLEGAQLAIKDLNKRGIDAKLIVEDDQTNPAKVHAAFEKLVSHDHVRGVLGGTWDFLAEAASPLALRHTIPFITPTNPVEILSQEAKNNPWFFTTGLSMRATEKAFKEVLGSLHPKRVALVAPNVPFGVMHNDLLEKLAPSFGFSILERVDFEFEGYHTTLRNLAARLATKKPDLIFCLSDYTALELFWKEVRRHKINPWLLTTQHLDEAVKLSGTPSLWDKAVGIYPKIESESFATQFHTEFGHAPKVYAAEGYDAALFLVQALRENISLSTQPFSLEGVSGKLSGGGGKTEITSTQAIALSVLPNGTLSLFQGER
ncbi:MAG: amino acid ABC transporter substrate-binding protein [Bdellovibrionales bacterium]|nr:amino acid ABC transporter substrate-binding protein [Bdellovibrionales bacterium]